MKKIGFLGLGAMGLPMSVNIARAGWELMVYNRTVDKTTPAAKAGALVADSAEAVFDWADTVIMMLSGPSAIEATLGRLLNDRPALLKGKLVVNMGTNPPSYSTALASRLAQAAARFVDAPVFGTQVPAEQGALLIMASGPGEAIEQMSPVFNALGNKTVRCGDVPKASMMKLAVNLVLSAAIEGLVEGAHFSKRAGLDMETFFQLILEGPLGNSIFAIKAKKLLEHDYSPQASLATVREMLKHVTDTAYEINACIPNTLSNMNLVTKAINKGLADEDACALIKVFND